MIIHIINVYGTESGGLHVGGFVLYAQDRGPGGGWRTDRRKNQSNRTRAIKRRREKGGRVSGRRSPPSVRAARALSALSFRLFVFFFVLFCFTVAGRHFRCRARSASVCRFISFIRLSNIYRAIQRAATNVRREFGNCEKQKTNKKKGGKVWRRGCEQRGWEHSGWKRMGKKERPATHHQGFVVRSRPVKRTREQNNWRCRAGLV